VYLVEESEHGDAVAPRVLEVERRLAVGGDDELK